MRRTLLMLSLLLLLGTPVFAQRNHERRDRGEYRQTGVVVRINRRLNYITIRSDQERREIKIDVRHMETRRSVNVWHLRRGDRIVVEGEWENRDTFDSRLVNAR